MPLQQSGGKNKGEVFLPLCTAPRCTPPHPSPLAHRKGPSGGDELNTFPRSRLSQNPVQCGGVGEWSVIFSKDVERTKSKDKETTGQHSRVGVRKEASDALTPEQRHQRGERRVICGVTGWQGREGWAGHKDGGGPAGHGGAWRLF